jgi:arylsulfate sulfotransferase
MFKRSLSSLVLFAFLCTSSRALTILTGPTFTPATNAPLAGRLQLTTDENCRVSVQVGDGTGTWTREFYEFTTNHSVALLGFKANRTNSITVTVHSLSGEQSTAPDPLVFVTPRLPLDFPNITLHRSDPARTEPGYTLFRVAYNNSTKAYHVIVNNAGEVVWYSSVPSQLDVRQLENGDLFLFSTSAFQELNLLGETVQTWTVPSGFPIDVHDGVMTDHGTILYLSGSSESVTGYPTSTTNPNAPLTTANNLTYQRVVEISATNSALLNSWSLIDLLDPRRITYMTTLGPAVWDSEHANAVIEDPHDNSVIASLRHQNAVVKISRATGQLVWILGPHALWGPQWQPYLLTPVGTPFEWQYAQHSPLLTPQGTLMIYDDGNFRSSPYDAQVADVNNYSRAVEYQINEQTMQVSQVWEYGSSTPERFYTDKVGDAEPLPQTGNVLITFGSIRYINGAPPSSKGSGATIARIQEVTHEPAPQVVFDLGVTEYDNPNASGDCFVYRSRRIPDLYAHPAAPVADLTVKEDNGTPMLEFSADPARTYTIEASTDLSNWEEIGTPAHEAGSGSFLFHDADFSGFETRFYRVVTH